MDRYPWKDDGRMPRVNRTLQALSLILCGAGLFAPAPWNFVIGGIGVVVALVLAWLSE